MKFLKSTLGYFFASVIINGCWGFFTDKFGIFGGYFAALFLTGSMWYINHHLGLISHEKDSAFIDMGLGIAICIVARGYMVSGVSSIITSIPTFTYVAIGAVLGGYVAVLIERNLMEKKCYGKRFKEENFSTLNLEVIDQKLEV